MKILSKLIRKAKKLSRKLFCRYVVICNYGGKIYCWNYKESIEWLACAGDKAIIVDIVKNSIVAARTQNI